MPQLVTILIRAHRLRTTAATTACEDVGEEVLHVVSEASHFLDIALHRGLPVDSD